MKAIGAIFLFLFIGITGVSQEHLANLRYISLSDGLSHQEVFCFLQDQQDMVWIGTKYGLNQYDGFSFKHYTHISDSLSSSSIHHLLEDPEGWIWAFTFKNKIHRSKVVAISLINSLTREIKTFESLNDGAPPFKIADIVHFFQNDKGAIHFVTNDQHWKYIAGRGFTSITHPVDDIPVFENQAGEYYYSNYKDLFWVDEQGNIKSKITLEPLYKNLPLVLEKDQFRWFGQSFSPIHFSRKENELNQVTLLNYPVIKRSRLHWDPTRKWMWYASEHELLAWDTNGKEVFNRQNTKIELKEIVNALYVDNRGLIWLGTAKGFYQLELKDNVFKRYLYENPESHESKELFRCRGMVESNNHLLVNTYLGTHSIDLTNDQIKKVSRPSSQSETIRHFLLQKDRNGLIFSANNNLFTVDSQTFESKHHYTFNNETSKIWAVHTSKNDVVWWDNGEGLKYIDKKKSHTFNAYNGFDILKSGQVYCYFEEDSERIWLGTNLGLFLMSPSQGILERYWSQGSNGHFLPGETINHIQKDQSGHLWMATENEGIIKWDPKTKKYVHLTKGRGLPSNTIYALYEDDYNNFWASSDFGLIQIDQNTLDIKSYLEDEGISFHEFNRASHYKADNGRIYFGGQNGITAFYPSEVLANKQTKIEILIKECSKGIDFGRELVDATAELKEHHAVSLKHNSRRIKLSLFAPEYFKTNKFTYFYSLAAIDNKEHSTETTNWQSINNNVISINSLVPGKFVLHIEARTQNGEVISAPFTMDLVIPPPFTDTALFYVLLFLFTIALVTGIVHFRTRQLQKRESRLQEMVEERTKELLKNKQIIEHQAAQIRQLDTLLNDADIEWMNEFNEVIKQKLSNFNLNISDIADEMNISRTHLFRKIKNVTGFTPNQFLQEARLKEAKNLLDAKKYQTIKAVALSVGFKNSSYFTRLFKERYGISPSEYFNEN